MSFTPEGYPEIGCSNVETSELEAEIQRLREDHAIVRSFLDKADAKLLSHEKLITELCDALEVHSSTYPGAPIEKLIQRGKEATLDGR